MYRFTINPLRHCPSSVACKPRNVILSCKHNRPGYAAKRKHTIQTAAGGSIDGFITTATLTGSLAAIGWTSLALIELGPLKDQEEIPKRQEDSMSDVRWGVMAVISFLPMINWMAWVFAALDSEIPYLYYAYAALYAVPLLRNGFQQDGFTIAMVVLCVVHVQLARIAATEPDTRLRLRLPAPARTVWRALSNMYNSNSSNGSGRASRPGEDQDKQLQEGGRAMDEWASQDKQPPADPEVRGAGGARRKGKRRQ